MSHDDSISVGNIHILLVEDNETDAELTINALMRRKLANKLHWVKDGAEALDFIFGTGSYKNHAIVPKLVLLDLRLPKVDGLEVLRRMKDDNRTRKIPVVILTSSKEDRDIVDSYNLGVNSFISKPVEFESFLDTVSELGLYWLLVNKVPY